MLQKLLLISFLFFFSLTALASTDPSIEQLENKLDNLATEPDSSQKSSLQDIWQQSIDWLSTSNQAARQARQYQKLMDDFPYQSEQLRKQLENYQPPVYSDPTSLSKKQLEQQLAMRSTSLGEMKEQRQKNSQKMIEIENQLSGFQTRVNELRQQLSEVQHKLDLQQFSGASDAVSQARLVLSQIKESSLSNQILVLELEQLSASNRNDLLQLEQVLINKRISTLQQYISELQLAMNQVRKQETLNAIERGEAIANQGNITAPALLALIAENEQYGQQLTQLNSALEETLQTQSDVARQTEDINNAVSNIREQVEWLKVSSAFGENLRSKLKQLPNPPPLEPTEQRIVEARLKKYDYTQALENLKNRRSYTKHIVDSSQPPLELEERAILSELLDARQELLKQLASVSDSYIYEQAKLKVAYSQMSAKLEQIKEIANQYLFWVPNVKPVAPDIIGQVLLGIHWLLSPDNFLQIPAAIADITKGAWLLYLLILALLLYAWYFANHFFRPWLAETASHLGKVTQDKFSYTFKTLILSVVLALPLPGTTFLLAWILQDAWQFPFAQSLGEPLNRIAWLLLLFMAVKNMARPNGLFSAHFKWQEAKVRQVFSRVTLLAAIALPATFIHNFALTYTDKDIYTGVGRIAFITTNVALAWFYWKIYKARLPLTYRNHERKNPHLLHHVVWPLLSFIPLLTAGLALLGYFYTGHALLIQMQASVLLGLIFLLTYFLIHRWMFIQKRRLAFDRAKARRAEILAQREKDGEDSDETSSSESSFEHIEEPVIDLETISAQSLGLLRTVLTLSYTLVLIYFWAQIYSAFSFLESLTIWSSSSSQNGIEVLNPVSLQDLIFAVFSLSIMFVIVRNLPGALELLVLQHFDLAPGTGFAITTVTKYLVIMTGVLTGCAFLGIDWSKTQWLVAALTVGLGFGLQEIFANFVSGLIILFEKPIRIGDTVTIRELTGTIAKIKTRATTIVDWDRKEIIVPNKAFITEQFINWSLSDPITRVITRVRVAFGSDTHRVTQELLQAANDCTQVLDSPAPEVFFVNFGESTLEFEIRAYVNDMGHRMPVLHELHSAIAARFKDAEIVINYPQMDLHLKRKN